MCESFYDIFLTITNHGYSAALGIKMRPKKKGHETRTVLIIWLDYDKLVEIKPKNSLFIKSIA